MLWEPNIVLVFFCGAAYGKVVFVPQRGHRSLFFSVRFANIGFLIKIKYSPANDVRR